MIYLSPPGVSAPDIKKAPSPMHGRGSLYLPDDTNPVYQQIFLFSNLP